MIYAFFIWEYPSGKILSSITFQATEPKELKHIFGGFFSALTSILQKTLETYGGVFEPLKSIKAGEFRMKITPLNSNEKSDRDIFFIILYDKIDKGIVKEFMPFIVKVLDEYSGLYEDWDGDTTSNFCMVEEEIMQNLRLWIYGRILNGKADGSSPHFCDKYPLFVTKEY